MPERCQFQSIILVINSVFVPRLFWHIIWELTNLSNPTVSLILHHRQWEPVESHRHALRVFIILNFVGFHYWALQFEDTSKCLKACTWLAFARGNSWTANELQDEGHCSHSSVRISFKFINQECHKISKKSYHVFLLVWKDDKYLWFIWLA